MKALPSRYVLVQCQPAMETPKQCVKYVQNYQYRHRYEVIEAVLVPTVNCQYIYIYFSIYTKTIIKTLERRI